MTSRTSVTRFKLKSKRLLHYLHFDFALMKLDSITKAKKCQPIKQFELMTALERSFYQHVRTDSCV